jgi:transcriptional regulator
MKRQQRKCMNVAAIFRQTSKLQDDLTMYIPKINLATDRDEIVSFMKQFSFATIVTAKDNIPIATHLPFLVSSNGENIVLTSHFAKANEQWKGIENHDALVIFSEPHAYISPKHYDKELNVPTWNYISIHAYGKGKLITETENVFKVLEKTIDTYENLYAQQWFRFPLDYRLKLANGIVAFEIIVNDLQAKKKLSQNRSEAEKQRIIDTLSKSNDTNEQLIADYMKKDQTVHK